LDLRGDWPIMSGRPCWRRRQRQRQHAWL